MNTYMQQIKSVLDSRGYKYDFDEEHQIFDIKFNGDNTTLHSRLIYDVASNRLEHLVYLDFKVPPEREAAICILLNLINDALNYAHLNLTSNWYIYCNERIYMDDATVLTKDQIERLTFAPLSIVSDFEKILMNVAYGDMDPHSAIQRFWEKRKEKERQSCEKNNRTSLKTVIKKLANGIIGKN